MYVVDQATMRRLDAREIAGGTESLELMERAGAGLARALLSRPHYLDGTCLIFCGKGNNGGDGFVVARLLHEAGHAVTALCPPGSRSEDAQTNFDRARTVGVEILEIGGEGEALTRALREAGARRPGRLVVDAFLGTGFTPPLREDAAGWCAVMGSLGRAVAAIDGPSGLDGDTGDHAPQTPRARWSFALGAMKWGLLSRAGRDRCGRLEVVDLGFDSEMVERELSRETRVARWVDASWVAARLGPVRCDAHKYSRGSVGVVGASPGMSGAVSLASRGALRAGAGLVEALVPRSQSAVIDAQCVETLVRGADEDECGGLSASSALQELCQRRDAWVIGPGAGRSPATLALLQSRMRSWAEGPVDRSREGAAERGLVLDADALFALAQSPQPLGGRCVLTPHSGELGRLLGLSSDEIADDRAHWVLTAAHRFTAVVLHKGAPTMVASPDGELAVIGAGGPGLATAGSGDVLSGVVGAFLAAGMGPFEAACAAAWVHGAAGDRGELARGSRGLVAGDLPPLVATVLRDLEGGIE